MTTPDPFAVEPEADLKVLDQLVNDYLDAAEGLEKWEARKRELADEIARKLGPGGRHEIVPGVGVTVAYPSRRFDPELARKVLDPTQLALICEWVPSGQLAAQRLPGQLADQLKVSNGRPTVRRIS